jgi:hypothetical protein
MSGQTKTISIRQIIADCVLLLGLILGFGALWYWLPGLGVLVGGAVVLALIFEFLKRLIPGFDEWWASCGRVAGRFIRFLVVLAIWGALLWYFAPEQGLTSKPVGSLTLNDLGGMLFWFCLVMAGGGMLFSMLGRP